MKYRLGFIGYGNMATAIAEAIVKSETLRPEEIAAFDVSPQAGERAARAGYAVADTVSGLCRDCGMLLLAVKPGVVASVLKKAGETLEGKAVMSIAAGVSSRKLHEYGEGSRYRVLRIMPNTPAMVSEGAMVLSRDTDFLPEERRQAEDLMSAVGIVEWMDEKYMDAVTGLSGSGPAYVALFIEALADGGVREGLSRPQALNLAIQTVLGTAKLLRERELHPAVLKDMVCSPGGTTIEGVYALEKGGFRYNVMEAVAAATEKSKNLV